MRAPLSRTTRGWQAGLVAVTAALAVVALSACGADNPKSTETGASPAATSRSVTHDAGATEVPAQPKRIVSLSISLTGHLLALEAPVVATQASPGPFSDPTGFFLQWADVAKQRNMQVAYSGNEVNLEKIVALKPDLIIGSASGADSTLKQYTSSRPSRRP